MLLLTLSWLKQNLQEMILSFLQKAWKFFVSAFHSTPVAKEPLALKVTTYQALLKIQTQM
jgi:hypothetical protein